MLDQDQSTLIVKESKMSQLQVDVDRIKIRDQKSKDRCQKNTNKSQNLNRNQIKEDRVYCRRKNRLKVDAVQMTQEEMEFDLVQVKQM